MRHEKIDYPEELSKQEKGNGVELNVSEVLYSPAGPHIVGLLHRVCSESSVYNANWVWFIPSNTPEREGNVCHV